MNIKKPDAVFFDWDGTLVDSYKFLNDAHNHLLVSLGFEPMKEGEYKNYFGEPRETLYPKIYKHRAEEAKTLFVDYVVANADKVEAAQGADTFLAYLHAQGIKMGVVSNKKKEIIQNEIRHLKWDNYFLSVVGAGEAVQDKPSGAPLTLGIEKASIDPKAEIWYVGDTENDLACARDFGCSAVFIRGHVESDALIKLYEPELCVQNCDEIKEILVAIS